MHFKNNLSRGIQQKDVWLAADSLVSEGLRPTIEKVRQKIGRGSPNTVSPMLDAWFSTLGARIGVSASQNSGDQVPHFLQQAMENIWQMALSHGQEEADRQVAQSRAELSQATEALGIKESEFIHQEQLRLAKQQVIEAALNTAQKKVEDFMVRLNQSQSLANKQEDELERLRVKLTVVEDERNLARCRLEEDATKHAQEWLRQNERSQATQHKLLEEIDKARHETKKIRADFLLAEKRLDAERSVAHQEKRLLQDQLSKAQELLATQALDLKRLREALDVSNLRVDQISSLLEKQQIVSETTISGLMQALSVQAVQQMPRLKLPARKVKRPIRTQKSDR